MFVKEKQAALKQKLENIAKQKAAERAAQLTKELKAAVAEKEKAEGLVKKASEESKQLKTTFDTAVAEEKKLQEQIKQVAGAKKAQEQLLQKVTQQLDGLEKKSAESVAKLAELKTKLAVSDKTVKDRLDAANALAENVRKVASKK